ncbi:MAG: response regulator [Dehalococcoidia bacterium]|nr:response regulator [Dehalococcoidia bacterium]
MDHRRVLVVDDDPVILRFVSANLRARGFNVVTATEGESALKTMASAPPDLIILDIMMPGFDGIEVCRRIREHSRVPVMIMSARAEIASQVSATLYVANDYLCKPFAIEELLSHVRALLHIGDGKENRPEAKHTGNSVLPLQQPAHSRTSHQVFDIS